MFRGCGEAYDALDVPHMLEERSAMAPSAGRNNGICRGSALKRGQRRCPVSASFLAERIIGSSTEGGG